MEANRPLQFGDIDKKSEKYLDAQATTATLNYSLFKSGNDMFHILKRVVICMINMFLYSVSFAGAELFWSAPVRIALLILAALFIFVGIAFSVFPPFRIDFGKRFFRYDWSQWINGGSEPTAD